MTQQHTPGPWHYGQPALGKVRIYAANNAFIAHAKFDATRGIANTRLIAASPDLLAAAVAANESAKPTADGTVSITSAAFDDLLRAIARAGAA